MPTAIIQNIQKSTASLVTCDLRNVRAECAAARTAGCGSGEDCWLARKNPAEQPSGLYAGSVRLGCPAEQATRGQKMCSSSSAGGSTNSRSRENWPTNVEQASVMWKKTLQRTMARKCFKTTVLHLGRFGKPAEMREQKPRVYEIWPSVMSTLEMQKERAPTTKQKWNSCRENQYTERREEASLATPGYCVLPR